MGFSYQILIPSKVPEEPLYGVIYKKKKRLKKILRIFLRMIPGDTKINRYDWGIFQLSCEAQPST